MLGVLAKVRDATGDLRGAEWPPGWRLPGFSAGDDARKQHGSDGRVLAWRVVDIVPTESKVCSQQGNTLRFASTVNPSRNQFSFAGEEGQEDTGGHGEEVEITTVGQGMARQPASELAWSFIRKIS